MDIHDLFLEASDRHKDVEHSVDRLIKTIGSHHALAIQIAVYLNVHYPLIQEEIVKEIKKNQRVRIERDLLKVA